MPIQRLVPIATQGVSGWTSFGALINHEALDEDVQNGDTDYIFSNSSPTGLFHMQHSGIQEGTRIDSVTIGAYLKVIAGGHAPPSFRLGVLIGAITFVLASFEPTDLGYALFEAIAANNPQTSQAWQPSNVANFIVDVTMIQAIGLPKTTVRVTQLYTDVTYTLPTWTERRSSA
jgi:hypothetical protein